ncbi:hypothetical protein ACWEPC_28225 [Nonomuraea sp. NPDC004297]
MALPQKNRRWAGVAISGAAAVLIVLTSAVVSVMIAVTTPTEGRTSDTSSQERIHLTKADTPFSSPTPGTLQAPVPTSSPSSSSPAQAQPGPTWTGKPGGEIPAGTFSKEECVKRGEDGLAAQKWSAYACKQLPKRDGPPKSGELVEDLEVVSGLATGDHRLWVVDWLCVIRMEENCE